MTRFAVDDLREHMSSRSGDYEPRIYPHFRNIRELNSLKKIEEANRDTQFIIDEIRALEECCKAYQQMLYERTQQITTAGYHMVAKLRRYKSYYSKHVTYHFTVVKVFDDPSMQPLVVDSTDYPGTDRRKAIDDFNAYLKQHPGIEYVKEIDAK